MWRLGRGGRTERGSLWQRSSTFCGFRAGVRHGCVMINLWAISAKTPTRIRAPVHGVSWAREWERRLEAVEGWTDCKPVSSSDIGELFSLFNKSRISAECITVRLSEVWPRRLAKGRGHAANGWAKHRRSFFFCASVLCSALVGLLVRWPLLRNKVMMKSFCVFLFLAGLRGVFRSFRATYYWGGINQDEPEVVRQ